MLNHSIAFPILLVFVGIFILSKSCVHNFLANKSIRTYVNRIIPHNQDKIGPKCYGKFISAYQSLGSFYLLCVRLWWSFVLAKWLNSLPIAINRIILWMIFWRFYIYNCNLRPNLITLNYILELSESVNILVNRSILQKEKLYSLPFNFFCKLINMIKCLMFVLTFYE